MAIVLQDYDPWENIGRLAGQYAGYRMGLNQQNNMAKTYNDTFNAPQQPNVDTTPVSTGGLWANAMRNHTPLLNTDLLQPTIQQGGLLTGNVQNVVPNQVDSSPVQQPQGGLPTGQPMQQGGLFTGQQTMNQISPFSDLPSSYEEWLKKKETTVTGNQDDSTPNRASVRKQTFQEMGQKILALVKGGFDFNTARQLANEWREQEEGDRYGQQVSQYQDTVLEPMRQQIINNLAYTQDKNGNYAVDEYNSSKVKGIYPVVARYNQLASKAGLPTIDMNNLNSIAALNKPDYKYQSVGNGDLLRFNGENGDIQNVGNFSPTKVQKFDDGRYMGVDGRGQVKQDYGVHNAPQDPRRNYVQTPNGLYNIATGQVVAGTQAPNRAGTGTSGYNAQIVRSLTTNHNNWVKNHPDQDESQSPYYDRLTEAMGVTVGASGGGTITPYSSEEQTMVANRMNELKSQGYTDDQIASELDSAGLGQYKSWLKTY